MAIIETKADEFMNLIYEKKQMTSKEAAKHLGIDEEYVRKLAYLFQKRKIIDLKTSLMSLTITLLESH
jgi:transcription initiation factor IIE alpha subunit